MTAWKHCERRVARAWGGRRRGPAGQALYDVVGVPVSLEVTRTKGGRIRGSKWAQCQTNAKSEGLPPVLVVADYRQRVDDMTVVCRQGWLLDLYHDAMEYRRRDTEERKAA